MLQNLISLAEMHQALLSIDSAVREEKWAEARKWVRKLVPAANKFAASAESPKPWIDLSRSAAELGRVLVREDRREYPGRFAVCMGYMGSLVAKP